MPSTLTQHRAGQAADTGTLSRRDWEVLNLAKSKARQTIFNHFPASAHRTRTAMEVTLAASWFSDVCAVSDPTGVDAVVEIINQQLAHAGLELRRKPMN